MQLTQQKLKELIIYCPLTGKVIWKVYRNGAAIKYSRCGTLTNDGYYQTTIYGKKYQLHNLIWCYMTGNFPTNQIDHINGVRDNNAWCNLRDVTIRENAQNQKAHRKGHLPGVQYIAKGNRFVARTWINSERIYLGCFKSAEEANKAYVNYLIAKGEIINEI